MPNLTANLVPTWLILAPLGPSWRQHRFQEASKWSSTGGLDRICGHLGAKRAPKSSTPQKWRSFSRKIVKKTLFFTMKMSLTEFCTGSSGIFRNPPETQHPVQNRPWVPHAGGQDDGSLHKLPQTSQAVQKIVLLNSTLSGSGTKYFSLGPTCLKEFV